MSTIFIRQVGDKIQFIFSFLEKELLDSLDANYENLKAKTFT